MDGRYLTEVRKNEAVDLRARFAKPKRGDKPTHVSINMDITVPSSMSAELIPTKKKHIVFVLDKSGSMGPHKGDPIEKSNVFLVKKSIIQLLESGVLNDDDLITVTVFNQAGELIVDHCKVIDFQNPYHPSRKKFDGIAVSGCTLIESGFDVIPKHSDDMEYMNIVVPLTDGKDFQGKDLEAKGKTRFTDETKVLKKLADNFGDSLLSVVPVLYGKDPSYALARSISKGNLILHIAKSEDIGPRMESLGAVIGNMQTASFKLKLKIGKYAVTIDDFGNAQPGYEYQRTLTIPLEAIGLRGNFPIDEDMLTKAEIVYTQNGQETSETLTIVIKPIPDKPGAKFYEDLEVTARAFCDEAINSELYRNRMLGKNGNLVRIVVLNSFNNEELEEAKQIFLKLLDYHDQLSAQNELDCTEVLNTLHDLLQEFGYVYKASQEVSGAVDLDYDPTRLKIEATDNASKSVTGNKVKLPKQVLAIVDVQAPENAGDRTHAGYKCLKDVASGMIGVHEGRAFIRFKNPDYRPTPHDRAASEVGFNTNPRRFEDYKLIDSTFDFSKYSADLPYGLISLDGGLTNREGVLLSSSLNHEYRQVTRSVDEKMQSIIRSDKPSLVQRLSVRTQILQLLLANPGDAEDFNLLIASFYGAKTLVRSDDKKIFCVDLINFLREFKGYCRHQVLLNALVLGQQVANGDLPPGSVNIHRSTAYNQNAHSVVLYETLDDHQKPALYLIDTTLNRAAPFNIFNPDELAEVVRIYNEKGLNGFLNELIEKRELKLEDQSLLKIDTLNRAMLEEFDEDEEFEPFRCPIETVTPSDPVHLVYKNAEGQEYLSKEIYERDAIETWMAGNQQGANLSPITKEEIFGVVEAVDAKIAILKLVNAKRQCSKPEEAARTGVVLMDESNSRLQKRMANRKKIFEQGGLEMDQFVLPTPTVQQSVPKPEIKKAKVDIEPLPPRNSSIVSLRRNASKQDRAAASRHVDSVLKSGESSLSNSGGEKEVAKKQPDKDLTKSPLQTQGLHKQSKGPRPIAIPNHSGDSFNPKNWFKFS